MKIETVEAKIVSNIPEGKRRQVGVSKKGMQHIMALLTNLYNDRELAVIREYYTNGLDAHQMTGTTAPIRVTLPTWDKPNYVVQDSGVGMTEDTLFETYGEYGESTGRDSNDIVGGFGLGSKSAYSIANQFTVISVKDGTRTTALFSKMAHGAYDVQIISSLPTPDANGTTVSIPISSDLNVFNSKAKEFFAFSEPGSVLVNGKEPDNALESAERLLNPKNPDMLVFVRPKGYGDSHVIMGNVPYVLSGNEIMLSLKRLGVTASNNFVQMPKYFRIPIGSVDLSPSREGIQMTDRTNELIDSYISFIVNDLQEIAMKELDTCATLEEFFVAHKRWTDMITVPRKFKGESVPTELALKSDTRQISKSSYSNAVHTETNWVHVKVPGNRIVVTGYSAEQYKKVNNYLTPYMAAKNINQTTFIITDDKEILTNKWIHFSDRFEFVSGEDLVEIGRAQRKKERLEASKLNGSSKKTKIRYPVLFVDEAEIRWVDHDEIDSKTPYLQASDFNVGVDMSDLIKGAYKSMNWDRSVPDALTDYFELVTDAKEIILLSNTRTVKALVQRVKETTPLIDKIKEAVATVDVVITEDVVRYHAVRESSWHRFLRNAGIADMLDRVNDPAIIEIITPTEKTLKDYKVFETTTAALEYFRYPGMPYFKYIDVTKDKTIMTLDRKYPLISALNAWNLKSNGVGHIIKYFNMIHDESKLPLAG